MKGYLVLENGQIFEGERFGSYQDTACEVVFNTGMVGYVETFTDPSYAGQGIVMTYPLIGNYGVCLEDCESKKIWAKAIFVHDIGEYESNFRSQENVDKFLKDNNVPGLKGVNTRKLTKILRDSGTMKGYLTSSIGNMEKIQESIENYEIGRIVEEVSTDKIVNYGRTKPKQVALLDFGAKDNIVNSLLKRGVGVTVYPSNTKVEMILATRPDGIMLSNGPGNPEDLEDVIENIKELIGKKPIVGICLGHQLLALTLGGKTSKLKFGHRGPNHPVKDLKTDRVYITSQNHGYYILEESLNPEIAEVTHINLNDNTVEGMRHKELPIYSVQYHPEACPGPKDNDYIFDKFLELV